jgi:hypothetical protein
MDNDVYLKVFSKILSFIKELNDTFGDKHDNVRLFYKLYKKTSILDVDKVKTRVELFKKFVLDNKDDIINGTKLSVDEIKISEKVYIKFTELFKDCDKDTSLTILKHLRLILYIINPSEELKTAIITPSKDSQNSKEDEFLKNFMNKVEDTFKDGDIPTDPLQATMSLLQSGVISDLMGNITSSINNGGLDIKKLLGSVQGMMGNLQNETKAEGKENPVDIVNSIVSTMGPLLNSMGGNSNSPDLSSILGMMGGMNNSQK